MIRVLDSAGSTLMEWGRQQQQHVVIELPQMTEDDPQVDIGKDIGEDVVLSYHR